MDGKGYLRYFSIAICVLVVADGSALTRVGHDRDKSDPDWDFFIFVQQDPAGYCYFNDTNPPEPCPGEANIWPESQDCYYPANMTTLTLHGIWPTKNDTKGPNWCNNTKSFDPHAIQDLIPDLVAEWTNVHPDQGFYNFWCHEWTKHGTCASGIPSMSTEYGFFSKVLSLFKEYNYSSVLDKHNITPSSLTSYKVDDFNAAFNAAYGVKPYLECKYDKEEKKQILIQISLCLTKNFTIFECPSYIYSGEEACWTSEPVHYLPVVRSV